MTVTPEGKHTPAFTCPLWGSTLTDIYFVSRIPGPQFGGDVSLSRTTGSKLLRWMKEINELDVAFGQIEWAEHEPDPRQIEPVNVLHLLSCLNKRRFVFGPEGDEKPLQSEASSKGKTKDPKVGLSVSDFLFWHGLLTPRD